MTKEMSNMGESLINLIATLSKDEWSTCSLIMVNMDERTQEGTALLLRDGCRESEYTWNKEYWNGR